VIVLLLKNKNMKVNAMELFVKQKYGWLKILMGLALFAIFTLGACASNAGNATPGNANCPHAKRVNYSFEFDMRETPDIEILDYSYGFPNCPIVENPDYLRGQNKSLQATSIYGPMLTGGKLNVKWRIKSTGKEYEDTVDLGSRLPRDIEKNYLTFMIKNSQLYIYLVTREFREKDAPQDDGPKAYTNWRKTLTIYPDQPK
jgi:hypothetical protein